MDDEIEDRRAGEAFRAALTRAAGEAPLDVAAPQRPARRPWRWVAAGAAAAVAASAVVAVSLVGGPDDDGALDPTGEPPAIAEGWRGVTFRDVTVSVPEDWGDGYALDSDWCADVAREPVTAPFVDVEAGSGAVLSIGCPEQPKVPEGFGPEPQELWVPHLELLPVGPVTAEESLPDGATTHEGWTLRVLTIGEVQLRLLTDAGTEALADEVVGSARRTSIGSLGCDTTSPAQEPPETAQPVFAPTGDLRAVDADRVEALLVCQYDRVGTSTPGLRAEGLVEGPDARAWLEAVREAPRASGPDRPENCLDPWESGMALAVHPLDEGGHRVGTAYVTADACAGNGLRDARTTYQLTSGTCAPLYGGRVAWWGGQAAVGAVCMPPGR